jgi:phosphoribosylamine--glycine ligase
MTSTRPARRREKLSGAAFGDAGTTVVIEEGLDGRSARCTCSVTARTCVALVPAQDFKRVGDDNQGANTGGMGAYAPMTNDDRTGRMRSCATIITPTVRS